MEIHEYGFWGCGVIAAAIFLIWLLAFVYRCRGDQAARDWLYLVLFTIDQGCDDLELPQKKREVVAQIMELLGWRRVIVPAALVSWCLSILVWTVRKTGLPDLHNENGEEKNDGKNGIGQK